MRMFYYFFNNSPPFSQFHHSFFNHVFSVTIGGHHLRCLSLAFKESDVLGNVSTIEKTVRVDEKILNFFQTRKKLLNEIKRNKINLYLNKEFKKNNLKDYDKVIIATYSNNNNILSSLGIKKISTNKYQLVEKILIKLSPLMLESKIYF